MSERRGAGGKSLRFFLRAAGGGRQRREQSIAAQAGQAKGHGWRMVRLDTGVSWGFLSVGSKGMDF